jgi:hypothetical protein
MTLKTHSRALGLLAAAFALSVPGAQAQTPANAPAPISGPTGLRMWTASRASACPCSSARTSMRMAARRMIAGPPRGRPPRAVHDC